MNHLYTVMACILNDTVQARLKQWDAPWLATEMQVQLQSQDP